MAELLVSREVPTGRAGLLRAKAPAPCTPPKSRNLTEVKKALRIHTSCRLGLDDWGAGGLRKPWKNRGLQELQMMEVRVEVARAPNPSVCLVAS